jgi:linoleoyl-CoA desaturase
MSATTGTTREFDPAATSAPESVEQPMPAAAPLRASAPALMAPAPALTLDDLAACRPSADEIARSTRSLRAKAGMVAALALVSYVGLVFVARGPLLALPFAALLVVALIATGTSVMHDANHGAFGASQRLNRVLGYSADVLGASSWFWRQKHNVIHHGNTNVVGIDTDIEQMPFARLAPGQPWKWWHRYQHIYIWAFYGFLTIQWVLFSDVATLLAGRIGSQPLRRRPRRGDIALMFLGKLLHVAWAIALPIAFHRWWVVVAFYFASSWMVGFVLAVFFQLAHCVDVAAFAVPATARSGNDFVAHQMRTTANVAFRTAFGRRIGWLMGGLQNQVEHHLAPGLPHTSYPAMSERIKRLCAARNVDYHVHASGWAALRSHGRWLRAMGRPVLTEG